MSMTMPFTKKRLSSPRITSGGNALLSHAPYAA
jgi:hypothetical protein